VVSAFWVGFIHVLLPIHFLRGSWRNRFALLRIMVRSIRCRGILNWFKDKRKGIYSAYFSKEEMEMLLPIITEGQSDSACLDKYN